MLQEAGFEVETMAFDNRHYNTGSLLCSPAHLLGRTVFKTHFLRGVEVLARAPKVRAVVRRNDIVYAFRFDMAWLGLAARLGLEKPLVVDIRDIGRRRLRGRMKRFVQLADKVATGKSDLLVLTSRHYLRYYHAFLNVETPALIVENKVPASFAKAVRREGIPASDGKPLECRPLRIGYFGLIGNAWSLRLLERLTSASDGFEAVIRGVPLPRIKEFDRYLERNPHIEYGGEYAYPDDLPDLYGSVDMVLVCYETQPPQCWARSNRYNESCLFQKPLIVRAGTADAEEVEKHQIGLVVEGDDIEDAVHAICAVTPGDLKVWKENMAALPQAVFAYTNESALLGDKIRSLAMGRGDSAHLACAP